MSGVLTEFRNIFKAIHDSGCICGMHSEAGDGSDFYIKAPGYLELNFGHLETCHKVISARVLGWKVVKK